MEIILEHRWFNRIARGVMLFDIALMALFWRPWYSGTANMPGEADRLFGAIRLGGFRVDFVWLILSTVIVFFLFLFSLARVGESRADRINAILCAFELATFYVFVRHILRDGTLWFG